MAEESHCVTRVRSMPSRYDDCRVRRRSGSGNAASEDERTHHFKEIERDKIEIRALEKLQVELEARPITDGTIIRGRRDRGSRPGEAGFLLCFDFQRLIRAQ